ncbi:MAG: YihY/virulence factor BrkB family protein [Thermoanaerobaculia bacterium]|nr:YihY/virulence factor BrkB family protein [Thermoanaerobaculia bacterium]
MDRYEEGSVREAAGGLPDGGQMAGLNDDTVRRAVELRDQFRSTHRSSSPGLFFHPLRFLRFLGLSLSKARDDEIPIQSAALAYITLLALVPLLAGLSYFSAGFFADRHDELVQLLAQVLPYTEQTITDRLADFLVQSRDLRGLAFFAFLITALSAFIAIERSINNIWNVTAHRSFRSRVSSFVQLLLFGPILIVGTYSFVFYLGKQPAVQLLKESFLVGLALKLVPTVVTAVGLTVLYWQVPNTRVRFRSALTGGVLAALLIEALRYGFRAYVDVTQNISAVYGSFGLVLLFIISVQLTWAIVLLGAEVAYCTQNYSYMANRPRDTGVLEGSWLGLSTLVVVIERFRTKQPITPHETLAQRLALSVADLRRAIQPLVTGELLRENLGENNGYLLSCDPYQVKVREVLDLYESHQWHLLDALPQESAEHLEDLRARLAEHRTRVVAEVTLSDLMASQATEQNDEPQREENDEAAVESSA